MSANCANCGIQLCGKWGMSLSGHLTTGRFLGVEAHFICGEHQNWVYSYCNPCWQKEIEKLPFVAALHSKIAKLEQETQKQKEAKSPLVVSLKSKNTALETANQDIQQNNLSLQKHNTILLKQIASLQQNCSTLKEEIDDLKKCIIPKIYISQLKSLQQIINSLPNEDLDQLKKHNFPTALNEKLQENFQHSFSFFVANKCEELKNISAIVSQQLQQKRQEVVDLINDTEKLWKSKDADSSLAQMAMVPFQEKAELISQKIKRWETLSDQVGRLYRNRHSKQVNVNAETNSVILNY